MKSSGCHDLLFIHICSRSSSSKGFCLSTYSRHVIATAMSLKHYHAPFSHFYAFVVGNSSDFTSQIKDFILFYFSARLQKTIYFYSSLTKHPNQYTQQQQQLLLLQMNEIAESRGMLHAE
jgi:hypothetical protein